jgi:hypothetical protein
VWFVATKYDLKKRQVFEFAHGKQAKGVAYFHSSSFNPQIDGRDEMFRWQGTTVLGHDLESRFVWNKKHETSRSPIGIGFAEPAVAQLTTECYQCEPPR